MQRLTVLIIVVTCILHVNSYLLKDKKHRLVDDNEPKEDPYQKTVKNGEEEENQDQQQRYYSERMHSPNHKKKARQFSNYYSAKSSRPQPETEKDSSLESVMLSLNTGIKKILEQNNKPDYFDKYAQQLMDLFKSNSGPMFRGVDHKYSIKPEQLNFNQKKPTTKVELNSAILSKVLGDVLKSDAFKENFDSIVKQASVIYRSLQDNEKKKED